MNNPDSSKFFIFAKRSGKGSQIDMEYVNKAAFQSVLEKTANFNARLVAVSKTYPPEAIMELYNLGHRDFGENKVQELLAKQKVLPPDIRWHLIGHLQSNKVKTIVPFVHLIHSVDSLALLETINKHAGRVEKIQDCLIQVHISSEETKFGLQPDEVESFVIQALSQNLLHVRICGLMGMASFTEDSAQITSEFRQLRHFFETLKNRFHFPGENFVQLSMGMTGDYEIALREGSSMVRIGSLIFGQRQ